MESELLILLFISILLFVSVIVKMICERDTSMKAISKFYFMLYTVITFTSIFSIILTMNDGYGDSNLLLGGLFISMICYLLVFSKLFPVRRINNSENIK